MKTVVTLEEMNNKPKIWAVGDIHGHLAELKGLYQKMLDGGLDPDQDTVVFLGDYPDGGPNTNGVIEWCMKKEKQYPQWKFLYGNHGDLMLDALVWNSRKYGDWYLWWNQGGRETAHSYINKNMSDYERALAQPEDFILKRHLSWLMSRPVYYETDDYFFVHAGVHPDISLEKQKHPKYAQDLIWIRDEFIESDYSWGKKIIFGHTTNYDGRYGQPPFSPIVRKNKIGIDGMAHNKGQLIAVELPDEKFYYQKSLSEDIDVL